MPIFMPKYSLIILFIFLSDSVLAERFDKTLIPVSPDQDIINSVKRDVKSVSFFHINTEQLQILYKQAPLEFEYDLPNPSGKALKMSFKKSKIQSDNFKIFTSGGVEFKDSFESPLHFQGYINGRKSSVASISFTSTSIFFVGSEGDGNFNLVKLKDKFEGKDLYAFYNDKDLLKKNNFQCHSEDLDQFQNGIQNLKKSKGGTDVSPQSDACRKVTIHFDLDYQMYLDNGSSVPNTVTWFQSMFNVLAAVYTNENIKIEVSEVMVATRQDFWPEASSFDVLDAYGDTIDARDPFIGTLSHLLSTKNLSHGGVAYLDVLCNTNFNYAYSNINFSFAQLPVYSWTISVIAHELGHNFGSPHTQNCNWEVSPGVFGILDSCFTPEGSCYSGPVVPILGTIMSYCHLVSGIDLAKGFGLLPGNLMRANFISKPCLEGNVTFQNIFVSSSDTLCSGSSKTLSVTFETGATYSWSGPNNFSSSLRTPTINNVNDLNAGEYSVILSKSGCSSSVYKTRITIDCIPVLKIPDISLCQAQVLTVSFVSSDPVSAGNVYTVEMSNANGSFVSPVVIGSINSVLIKNSIQALIPASLAPGMGYKIRIRSSNPQKTGKAYVLNLSVTSAGSMPIVSNQSRCNPGTLTFSASGNAVHQWFNDSLSITPLITGNVFTTPVLSAPKSYWVSAQNQAKVNFGPVNPFFTGSASDLSNYSHGLFIKVLKDVRIDTLTIYPTGTGLVRLNVKDSANLITYAQTSFQVNNATGQAVKLPVGFTLSPGVYRIDPSGSTIDNLLRSVGTVNFPITSAGLIQIIGATAADRYYWYYNWKLTTLDCPSPRKKIQALFTGAPASPSVVNVSRCGPGTIALVASGASTGETYRWYTTASGLTPITGQTSATFNVASLNSTNTWFVSIVSSNACESQRVAITASVNLLPIAPTVTAGNRCGTGTVALSAAGSGQSYKWYNVATGGTAISGQTSAGFTTLSISQSTTYYVSVIGNGNCESSRSSVLATVNTIPQSPAVTAGNRCGIGTVSLSAAGSGQSYKWYNVATGGTAISGQTSAGFTTTSISQSTTYYVSVIGNGNCESSRSSVLAGINPIPENPTVINLKRCGPGIFQFTALGGSTFNWFSDINSAPIAGQTGNIFASPVFNSGTITYYVSILSSEGCLSQTRVPVAGEIIPQPSTAIGADSSRCGPGILRLTASGALAGETYRWYPVPFSTILDSIVGTNGGNGLTTALLSQTKEFSVVKVKDGFCESAQPKIIKAVILSEPQAPVLEFVSGFIKANLDTVYNWYRNGLLIGSYGDSLDLSIFGNGSYYAELLKSNTCKAQSNTLVFTSSKLLQSSQPEPVVFPNPTNQLISIIGLPESEISRIQMFDYQGKLLLENKSNASLWQSDISSQPAGLYIIRIQTRQNTWFKKVRKD